jgi:hypothetical protein
MAFERLFEDPMAALGYGLLTSRSNPLGTGFDVLGKAQETQRAREDSAYTKQLNEMKLALEMQKLQQPDLQFNPVSGEMVNMRTGTPFNSGQIYGGTDSASSINMPSGLNPLQQKIYTEQAIKSKFETDAAKRESEQKIIDEKRQSEQKIIDEKRQSEQKMADEKRKLDLAKREELTAMTSKMPELEKNISEMSDLAQKATYSPVGRGIDTLANVFGTSTGGQDALVDYTNRISNQVLPLLKDTFGSAFTVQEGENLKATLGSPDMTPSQKQTVLNNFINQKKANIIAKQRELGIAPSSQFTPVATDSIAKMSQQERQAYRQQLMQAKGQ